MLLKCFAQLAVGHEYRRQHLLSAEPHQLNVLQAQPGDLHRPRLPSLLQLLLCSRHHPPILSPGSVRRRCSSCRQRARQAPPRDKQPPLSIGADSWRRVAAGLLLLAILQSQLVSELLLLAELDLCTGLAA